MESLLAVHYPRLRPPWRRSSEGTGLPGKIIPFIIVLGLLIFFHELGHFLAAKFFGVQVIRFSFGLGPRLVGIKGGETDYCLSAFPLGGFVKMVGEGTDEKVSAEEQERSFAHKPIWQRIIIVFCGPLFNFAFALAVFSLVFWPWGRCPDQRDRRNQTRLSGRAGGNAPRG